MYLRALVLPDSDPPGLGSEKPYGAAEGHPWSVMGGYPAQHCPVRGVILPRGATNSDALQMHP